MNDDELKAMLAHHESAGAPRFAPGFADRVISRAVERPMLTLDRAITQQTRRLLPALAAASMALALWNWYSVRDRAPSALGAMLGVASTAGAGTTSSAFALGLTNAEAFE
ncbi:MAG: hypothetical protein ABI141_03520 [Gemmatimonadaceae bacterium]